MLKMRLVFSRALVLPLANWFGISKSNSLRTPSGRSNGLPVNGFASLANRRVLVAMHVIFDGIHWTIAGMYVHARSQYELVAEDATSIVAKSFS
jgi:hypothetical protein